MNLKLLLVGVLTIVLLLLYFYSVKLEIDVAEHCRKDSVATAECTTAKAASGRLGDILSGVGGLIAAFAISALAVTQPGAAPNKGLTDGFTGISQTIAKAIPVAFVLTWLICGLLAVYFGLIKYDGSEALTEMGKNWFGTVLAGVGAWVGIDPKKTAPPQGE